MPTRLIIAYSLIAVLLIAGATLAWWVWYNLPARAHARDRLRRYERDKLAEAARK